jgi:FlgD Ig-like domain
MLNEPNRRCGKIVLLFASLILFLGLGANRAQAFSSNPPNERTNAPGEGNCTACHSSFALNSGTGTLAVTGPIVSYVPGQSYDLQVELQDPDASRWGFEFTIIGADGNEIGSLTSLDGQTQVGTNGVRTYGKHTSAGTQNGTTTGVSWTVRWTAPAAGAGDATIYLAGNAANGNGSNSGDRIYAISDLWTENTASPAPLPALAGVDLQPNYPNPFNPLTTIAYELDDAQSVRLTVYSVDGRLVRRLEDGFRGEGRHEVQWNGLNQQGQAVPSGTYFYHLQAGGAGLTRSMVLVR